MLMVGTRISPGPRGRTEPLAAPRVGAPPSEPVQRTELSLHVGQPGAGIELAGTDARQ